MTMENNELQFIEYQQKRRLWRCRIIVGELVEPPTVPKFEVIFVTPWMHSVATAESLAVSRYFPIYEFRHGFKHPEDPSRTRCDPGPPAGVVVMTSRAA